ncbi:MAG: hypothetical protein NUV53_01640 [Patescibacteria group bacterium]|nr:hypothetical protein [Patescibacteria group bacterium]
MLTKKDLVQIKGTVTEVFEPFAKAVQTDFGMLNKQLDDVEREFREVKNDVQWMKENSGELFSKLDRFISMYEDQKKELAAFGMQMKRLEERVAKLERRR